MVVAPSRALSIISSENRKKAEIALAGLGLKVKYGAHVEEDIWCSTASVASRVSDLHAAFRDPEVKGILTSIGGFFMNQLLPFLDFELIKNNPKIICGFSDITALTLSIYQQTGIVTYSGPHFSTLAVGGEEGEYLMKYFEHVFFGNFASKLAILPSATFRDDQWFLSDRVPEIKQAAGPWVLRSCKIDGGVLIPGNLALFNYLRGTKYLPVNDSRIVLAVEWCDEAGENLNLNIFVGNLVALLQTYAEERVAVDAILVGRFEDSTKIGREDLERTRTRLIECGLISETTGFIGNLDFGHTLPIVPLPVGGIVDIDESGQLFLISA